VPRPPGSPSTAWRTVAGHPRDDHPPGVPTGAHWHTLPGSSTSAVSARPCASPGLPLGVDTTAGRPDHRKHLPEGATLVFFTDGLVEHHEHHIDQGLAILAQLATQQAGQPARSLCEALVGNCPGDGSDDIAILALRLPA
jgi:serine phosphatase RsbU (regulator of sigma subunit)